MDKKQEIIKAIGQLFGDTSLTPGQTLQALEEIRGEVQEKIDGLREMVKTEES